MKNFNLIFIISMCLIFMVSCTTHDPKSPETNKPRPQTDGEFMVESISNPPHISAFSKTKIQSHEISEWIANFKAKYFAPKKNKHSLDTHIYLLDKGNEKFSVKYVLGVMHNLPSPGDRALVTGGQGLFVLINKHTNEKEFFEKLKQLMDEAKKNEPLFPDAN